MKGLLGWVLLERNKKNMGNEVPVQFWKEMYADSRLMHLKINVIAKELENPFLPRPTTIVNMGVVPTDGGFGMPTGNQVLYSTH